MNKRNTIKIGFLGLMVPALLFTSCKKDEISDQPTPTEPPIELNCDDDYNYFTQARTLKHSSKRKVDYVINCQFDVTSPLTIEPGVVMEFERGASLLIDGINGEGSINAIGTEKSPIVMRGTKNERGHWKGIFINTESSTNKLQHFQISDGGRNAFNSNDDKANIIVYGTETKIDMEYVKSTNSANEGLSIAYANKSSNIRLRNSTISGNRYATAIKVSIINSIHSSNSFKGNDESFVDLIGGDIMEPSTWYKVDVPYRFLQGSPRTSELVTIQPGVKIEFDDQGIFWVRSENGGLKAVGTAQEPIIFTSASKQLQGWNGIFINNSHPENEIAFAEIHYSGNAIPHGNVYLMNNDKLYIHDVKFKNITGCAINYSQLVDQSPNPQLNIGANITIEPDGCLESVF